MNFSKIMDLIALLLASPAALKAEAQVEGGKSNAAGAGHAPIQNFSARPPWAGFYLKTKEDVSAYP